MLSDSRSSYDVRKSRVPLFIRRFFYRNPRFMFYVAVAGSASAFLFPWIKNYYFYLTMSKNDYEMYCYEERLKTLNRARYGEGLVFPFFTGKNFDISTKSTIERRKRTDEQLKRLLEEKPCATK